VDLAERGYITGGSCRQSSPVQHVATARGVTVLHARLLRERATRLI
jgi:hypothetical protein